MTRRVVLIWFIVVVINIIYNYVVDNFFYHKSFRVLNIHFIFLGFEIQMLAELISGDTSQTEN
jgi:hypothetical protein